MLRVFEICVQVSNFRRLKQPVPWIKDTLITLETAQDVGIVPPNRAKETRNLDH